MGRFGEKESDRDEGRSAHPPIIGLAVGIDSIIVATAPMSIVITGIGLVSPLAVSLDDLEAAVLAGRVAAGKNAFDITERAEVPTRRARRLTRLALMTVAAARSALKDAVLS